MKKKGNNLASKEKSSKSQSTKKSNEPLNSNILKEADSFDIKNVSKWSTDAIARWLKSINYADAEKHFVEHSINGRALLMLNEDDLKEIIRHNVGQRKNLYHLIRVLQIRYNHYMNNRKKQFFQEEFDKDSDINVLEDENELNDELNSTRLNDLDLDNREEDSPEIFSKNQTSYESLSLNTSIQNKESLSINRHLISEDLNTNSNLNNLNNLESSKVNKNVLDFEEEDSMPNFCENCLKKFDSSPYTNYAQNSTNSPMGYNGEKRKTLASALYLFLTSLWTAFMLTVIFFFDMVIFEKLGYS